nr:2,4'-dihydroxyacetophenone dioxygenase family protein [Nocardia yunnanensis]
MIEDSLGPGVSTKLLRLDMEAGKRVVLATFAPGVSLPIHYHTGTAEVYTLAGRWRYREYPDQPQTAGSYLYEPGGSVHTFYTPADNTEDIVMLIFVAGANVNFTDDGQFHSILDAVSIKAQADMFAAQGVEGLRYINGSATVIAGTD